MPINTQINVDHIYTSSDLMENYGAAMLETYIAEAAITIQSTKTLKDGKVILNNPYQLGVAWGDILKIILEDNQINLGQMMRNYQYARNIGQQQSVAGSIINIAVPKMIHSETHIEALILGVCMLLGDDADSLRPNNLVEYIESRTTHILGTLPEKDIAIA